jgi:hypothetical protein
MNKTNIQESENVREIFVIPVYYHVEGRLIAIIKLSK